MVVTPLQVHIGGPPLVGPDREDRRMAHARFEPDIEDVAFLLEVDPPTVGTGSPQGEEVHRPSGVPEVTPLPFHQGGNMLCESLLRQDMAAMLAVEGGDRDPPGPLPGDAPVRTIGDHV